MRKIGFNFGPAGDFFFSYGFAPNRERLFLLSAHLSKAIGDDSGARSALWFGMVAQDVDSAAASDYNS